MQEHNELNAQQVHSNEKKRDEILSEIAMAAIVEQRRSRRWSIVWKVLTFAYVTFFLISLIGLVGAGGQLVDGEAVAKSTSGKYSAIVNVKGVIADDSSASASLVIRGLQNAFKNKHVAGVILRINSPGGSPVQSAQIYDEMIRLQATYPEKPLYAVIEDIGASGGYYVASAAKDIYANRSSLVGSIGVIMGNFGFVDAMQRLGIERRVLTAGDNKALADPFSPLDSASTAHLQTMLNSVHQQFITAVKKGRGERLVQDDSVFSGLFWTAEQGLDMGLVDGFGDIRSVARDHIGESVLVDFTPKPDFFENFTNRFGVSVSNSLMNMFTSIDLQ